MLDILDLLASTHTPMTASEIGKALDIPKSSVFDLVNIMSERGYISLVSPYGKAYTVGISSYRTGMAYLNGDNMFSFAHPVLKKLSEKVGKTCYLAVEDHGRLVYIDKVESDAPIRMSLRVGSTNDLHCTGLGKAILASRSDEEVRRITDGKLIRHSENTICDIETLLSELDIIRRRGYAIDNGEDNLLLRCIAAPVYDRMGIVTAAISITMLDSDYESSDVGQMAKALVEASLEISKYNGYQSGF